MEAAYRRLPLKERWRVARDAGWGRTRGRPEQAAMLAWWARRELHRYPWAIGLACLAFLLVIALWPRGSSWWAILPFVGGLGGSLLGMCMRAPRMRRGIAANQEVVRAAGAPVAVGRPARVVDGRFALSMMGSLALVVAVLSWLPDRPTAHEPGPVPPSLDSPVLAPERLADDRPVGDVPEPVAAVWPGREMVAGVQAPELLATAEPCARGMRWVGEPVVGPALLGPGSVQIAVAGEVRSREAPRRIVLCEYEAGGTQRHADEHHVFDPPGELGGSGSSGPDMIITSRDVLVPEDADWALVDQGRWVLAVPVAGAPALRVRITTGIPDPEMSPSVGEVRFVTAQGRWLHQD